MNISLFLTFFPFVHTSFFTPRYSTCSDRAVGEPKEFGAVQHRDERYVNLVIIKEVVNGPIGSHFQGRVNHEHSDTFLSLRAYTSILLFSYRCPTCSDGAVDGTHEFVPMEHRRIERYVKFCYS